MPIGEQGKRAFIPSRSYLYYRRRVNILSLHRHTLLSSPQPSSFSLSILCSPQPPCLAPQSSLPSQQGGRVGCRALSPWLWHSRAWGIIPPSLPASCHPPAAASPSAMPPAPGETDVFIKNSCSHSSIYKQNLFLTNLIMK